MQIYSLESDAYVYYITVWIISVTMASCQHKATNRYKCNPVQLIAKFKYLNEGVVRLINHSSLKVTYNKNTQAK